MEGMCCSTFYSLCWPLGNVSILVNEQQQKNWCVQKSTIRAQHAIEPWSNSWSIAQMWKFCVNERKHISCNYRKLINGTVKLVKYSPLFLDSIRTHSNYMQKERINLVHREKGKEKKSISTWCRSGIHYKLCLKAFQEAIENCEVHN